MWKDKIMFFTYFISLFMAISITSPFWGVFTNPNSTVKFLGFKNVDSFLYSFSNQFTLFSISLFSLWILNFINEKNKNIKKIATCIFGCFLAISIHYLLWIFLPLKDFHIIYNQGFLIIGGILGAYLFYKLINITFYIISNLESNIKNLTSKIRNLTNFIVIKGKSHVNNDKEKKSYINEYLKLFKKIFE